MNNEIIQFLKNEVTEIIDECILAELNLDPKFGLVTPFTNGSHKDMNYSLMIEAKNKILPFFGDMIQEGWSSQNLDYIFKRIRLIGKAAEDKMNSVTGNVNAYKGLIFGMGILATAYSYTLYNHLHISSIYDIVEVLSKNILDDFNEEMETFGYYAFKEYNMLGARGEFHKGIPNVKLALKYLTDFSDEAKTRTLMFLISKADDTNLLKRAKNFDLYSKTKTLFVRNINADEEMISEINDYCIEHNLTFGGSADLLILTIFLKKIML
jgi:triphosphoribosyl-dephospho-CoA synthetase